MLDDFALGDFQLPLDEATALEILLKTETFCSDGISAAGYTPNQVRAFQTILNRPDAADRFEALVHSARTAGRLYALCGLFLTDQAAFQREVGPYRQSNQEISTIRGCRVGKTRVGDIVSGEALWPEGIRRGGWPEIFARAEPR